MGKNPQSRDEMDPEQDVVYTPVSQVFLLLQGKDLKFWPIIFPQVAVGGRGGKSL